MRYIVQLDARDIASLDATNCTLDTLDVARTEQVHNSSTWGLLDVCLQVWDEAKVYWSVSILHPEWGEMAADGYGLADSGEAALAAINAYLLKWQIS